VATGDLEPGSQLTVKWLGKPVFVRRRTEAEIAEAVAVPMADLPDKDARNANFGDGPADDKNRTIPPFEGEDTGEWLVMIGVYTSGRIRKGPAPENLPVPVAAFTSADVIKLG